VSESLAETIQKTLAPLATPDVRELKVLVASLQERIEQPFDPRGENSGSQFESRMAAFREFTTQSKLASARILASINERVAVLEARQ